MAAWSLTLLSPTASDAAVITTGPQMNRIAIPIVALLVPQAMIRGCRAMNKPANFGTSVQTKVTISAYQTSCEGNMIIIIAAIYIDGKALWNYVNKKKKKLKMKIPKLNMAIPSPASEIILIEYFTKLGIPTSHLFKEINPANHILGSQLGKFYSNNMINERMSSLEWD